MEYRIFGKTGLKMPVLSFGCMRSMHDWSDLPVSDIPAESTRQLKSLVMCAQGHGITHLETARGYGSSERQLGQVIAELQRDSIILQTKVVPEDDPELFTHNVLDSMDRLGVTHLDLLGLHGINDYRSLWQCCRKKGCLAAARRLQDKGLVNHIGFSGHGPLDVITQAISHEEDGGFDYLNLHWYYIYDVNRPAIELAAERNLGLFIISPTDKGGMLHTPPPLLTEMCKPLSPITFNDLYCLSQPGVSTISVGASRLTDFSDHLQAVELLTGDGRTLVQEIEQRLNLCMMEKTGYMRPEGDWNALPDHTITPGHINLRFTHWLYNLARGWNLNTFAQSRYNMLDSGSAWVQGNSCSNLKTLSFEDIRKKYPRISDAFLMEMEEAHELLKSAGERSRK